MTTGYCVAMTTADTPELADRVAAALVEQRLAACVQIMPISSHYVWNGKVRRDAELLLLIKAKSSDFDAINAAVKLLHSYEVPEVIRLDIADGDPAYLGWIASVTR